MRCVRDPGTVFEVNYLASLNIEVDRIHVNSGGEAGVAAPIVEIVGSLLIQERDGRVVTDLLHIYVRAIG